jgi:5-methylcytosine-specific restriction protein A
MAYQSASHTGRKHKKHSVDVRKNWNHFYGTTWQKYRKVFLRSNPLCVCADCKGKLTPAIVVDHIIPHRGDQQLFWDTSNHQALAKRCHDRKTMKEVRDRQ